MSGRLAIPRWRPIKSAPKGGTRVLLCFPSIVFPSIVRVADVAVGRWITADPTSRGYNSYSHWRVAYLDYYNRGESHEVTPTHWQPLPKPPARGGESS